MNLKDTYDQIAQHWSREHDRKTWWQAGTKAFSAILPKNALVLDIGCGNGQKAAFLMHHGLHVTGIDFSPEMIKLAQQKAPNGTFSVLDVDDLDFLPEHFDGVYASAVLLHVHKIRVDVVLASMRRRLKRNGFLYLTVKEIRPKQPEETTITETDYGFPVQRFYSFFTSTELRHRLEQAGFIILEERIQTVGLTRWIQAIAQKQS